MAFRPDKIGGKGAVGAGVGPMRRTRSVLMPGADDPRLYAMLCEDQVQAGFADRCISTADPSLAFTKTRRTGDAADKPCCEHGGSTRRRPRRRLAFRLSEAGWGQGCGCGGGASGRRPRSFMNWSNSALSLAWRSRFKNSKKSRCSSSSRRNVSARYSSKARLPLDGP